MPSPSPKARTSLDSYIEGMLALTDGLTLDDFRALNVRQAQHSLRRVRTLVQTLNASFMSLIFILLIFAPLSAQIRPEFMKGGPEQFALFFGALWAFALGGLGAVASIYLHVMRVRVQEVLRTTDPFEVKGRVFLGCLFSTVLAVTLIAGELDGFFRSLMRVSAGTNTAFVSGENGLKLLLPFLAGYSLPLVLKLLEKAIQSVELTLGLDDPKAIIRQLGRRITRRGA